VGVRGPPTGHSPSYWPGLPLLHAAVFTAASLAVRCAATPERLNPWVRVAVLAPGIQEVPALGPGTRQVPAFAPPALPFCGLSPYEVPKLGVLQPGGGLHGPQAACLGAGRESHPPRYWPSYRAPPVMASRVSGASSLPRPPGALRHPQHRPAPHASRSYGFTPRRGWDSHPLSQAQPWGFCPHDHFRVAQRLAPDPSGLWSAVEPKAVPRTRCVECRASQDFPRHAASPAFPQGAATPACGTCPAPVPPGMRFEVVIAGGVGPAKKTGGPKGTSLGLPARLGLRAGMGFFVFSSPFGEQLPFTGR